MTQYGSITMIQSINKMVERHIRFDEKLMQSEVKFKEKKKVKIANLLDRVQGDLDLEDSVYSELFKEEIINLDLTPLEKYMDLEKQMQDDMSDDSHEEGYELLAAQAMQVKNQLFRNQRILEKDMERVKKEIKKKVLKKKKMKLIIKQKIDNEELKRDKKRQENRKVARF